MATTRMYRLAEAARVADAPEEELLRAIRDGLLLARQQQNTGEYAVHSEELARWVKRSRHADPFRQVKKKKVLILAEDMLFAGTLKLELGRNERIDARFATWGQDAILMVNHYNADLYVVDLSPSKVPPDEVLAAVASHRAEGRSIVIATCLQPRESLDAYPLVRSRLEGLSSECFVPRGGGMRALLVALHSVLGLQTNTRVIKIG
jgi:PleD family two-component response regulator